MYICARIHDLKKEEQLKALLRRPKTITYQLRFDQTLRFPLAFRYSLSEAVYPKRGSPLQ